MGALDFLKEFEGRVLDAASYQLLQRNYELQEENNNQLKEKVERLESDNVALRQQVDEALKENKKIEEKLANLAKEDQFSIYKGFAFKRGEDGKFEPTGYCPNCYLVMSKATSHSFLCPKCSYVNRCVTPPEVLANQLNAKSKQ